MLDARRVYRLNVTLTMSHRVLGVITARAGSKGIPGKNTKPLAGKPLILYTIEAARPVEEAVKVMSEHDFSQISVTKDGRIVGSLNEAHLYSELVRDPQVKREPVESIMQPAFPFVDISTPVEAIATMITPAETFWPAEDYHQRYLEKRGRATCAVGVADAEPARPSVLQRLLGR